MRVLINNFLILVLLFFGIKIVLNCRLPREIKLREQFAMPGNSESIFAHGQRIRVGDADLTDLEQIPGVSIRLLDEVFSRRHEIISSATHIPSEQKCHAFELVKGLGPKTAQTICSYIAPE